MGPSFPFGRLFGVPVRVHWTAPIGLYFFGGSSASGALAWLSVILAHELGHALFARKFAGPALEISVHAFGGECTYIPTRLWSREIVAWGGVVGQLALALLVASLADVRAFYTLLSEPALHALIPLNLLVAAANLLPIGNLDGVYAWRLLKAIPVPRAATSASGRLMRLFGRVQSKTRARDAAHRAAVQDRLRAAQTPGGRIGGPSDAVPPEASPGKSDARPRGVTLH